MNLQEMQTPGTRIDWHGHKVEVLAEELLTLPLLDHLLDLGLTTAPFGFHSRPDSYTVITKHQTSSEATFAFTR
jgi:hypothetical protein